MFSDFERTGQARELSLEVSEPEMEVLGDGGNPAHQLIFDPKEKRAGQ